MQERLRPSTLATTLLAALAAILPAAATLLTGWYRETWMWENPVQAVAGAALAVLGAIGSLVVAVNAWHQRLRTAVAIGLSAVLLVAVVLGCLLFIRSGAAVIPIVIGS